MSCLLKSLFYFFFTFLISIPLFSPPLFTEEKTITQNKPVFDHILDLHKHYQNQLFKIKGLPVLIEELSKNEEGVFLSIRYAPRFSKQALPYLEQQIKFQLEESLLLFKSELPTFNTYYNEDESIQNLWDD